MKEHLPFCSIVVLNWNGREHLEECFSSLSGINYPKDCYETIMVDNASSDDSIDFVKKRFPWVNVLALDKNYGYAEGNNRGIATSKGEFVLILNNDVRVDKDFLIELMKVMIQDDRVAVCGSKILDYKNPKMIQYAGARLDVTGAPYHIGAGEIDCGQYDEIKDAFYAFGCSALYRKSALNGLKVWYDPSFFINCEETDLCWRLKYLGYKVLYVPKSFIYHKGGVSTSKIGGMATYYLYRNKIWMFKKNLRPPLRQAILSLVCIRMFFIILYRMLCGQWTYGFEVFRHIFDKKESDVDMSKISFRRQLAYLSPPIIEKYVQFLTKKRDI
jgi:hypothetical protein